MKGGGSASPAGTVTWDDRDDRPAPAFTMDDALDLLERESDPVALGDLVQQINELFERRDEGGQPPVSDLWSRTRTRVMAPVMPPAAGDPGHRTDTVVNTGHVQERQARPAPVEPETDTGIGVFQGELPVEEPEVAPSPTVEPIAAPGFDEHADFGPVGSGWDRLAD